MKAAAAQIEKAMLSLPPAERAQVAMAAWDSLELDGDFGANPAFDPEGLALARKRDTEIESGASAPLSHEDFLKLTGGPAR